MLECYKKRSLFAYTATQNNSNTLAATLLKPIISFLVNTLMKKGKRKKFQSFYSYIRKYISSRFIVENNNYMMKKDFIN